MSDADHNWSDYRQRNPRKIEEVKKKMIYLYLDQNTIQNIHFLKDFAGIFMPGPATEDFEGTSLFLGFYLTTYLCTIASICLV